MENERHAGGLWCREVLAALADYVDGELDAGARRRVEAHLGECDVCERFGGEYADTVRRLRTALAEPPAVDGEIRARLLRRLRETP